MTAIVSHYDATKWASVTGSATMETIALTTTLPASVLGVNGTATKSASAGPSIATFKGDAAQPMATGGLKAMAAVGAMVLGFAALL